MAQFNLNTQPRDPDQTTVRGNVSQLKLCLEAGVYITQNQPLEVALMILPEEVPLLPQGERTSAGKSFS